MKDFRKELLEFLLEYSGEYVSIMELFAKYYGQGNTFEQGDETMIYAVVGVRG